MADTVPVPEDRNAQADDIIQFRIESCSPYFREVTTNRGIYVTKPMTVISLVEVDQSGQLQCGGFYYLFPLKIFRGHKTYFVLFREHEKNPVRMIKLNEVFHVREICDFEFPE